MRTEIISWSWWHSVETFYVVDSTRLIYLKAYGDVVLTRYTSPTNTVQLTVMLIAIIGKHTFINSNFPT